MLLKFTRLLSILSLLLVCSLYCNKANASSSDTLTNRQVYNFSVGDTFDYYVQSGNADDETHSDYYERRILMSKTYSANLDSLFLVYYSTYSGTKTDIITHLDSVAIFQDSASYPSCGMSYSLNDSTFPGHLSDSVSISCFEAGASFRYTHGLGRTYFSTTSIAYNSNGCICYSEELIYYANDSVHIGSPYYVTGGDNQIHYIPLPEECAVWTETITGYYPPTSYPPVFVTGTIIEQFKTGNKIYYHNKTFIELYLSVQNNITNTFKPDSLFGYFYNDSINEEAFYVTDTNSTTPYSIYSCKILAGESCSNGLYQIDSILIGGSYRTYWKCTGSPEYNCGDNLIAGIGYLSGLFPNGTMVNNTGLLTTNGQNNIIPACSSLSCFSVCNQTLYPTESTTTCPLLNSVPDINQAAFINIYPNPATDNCTMQLNNATQNFSASILDITGREILPLFDNQQISTFNFNTQSLASGVYLVRLTEASGKISIVKLIKE